MKKWYRLLSALALLLLLSPPAFAAEIPDRSFESVDGKSVENAVPEEARELLDGAGIRQDLDFTGCLKTLLSRACGRMGNYVKQSLSGGVKLFAAAVLCTLTAGLSERMKKMSGIAGTLALTLIAVGDMNTLLGLGRTTVTEIAAFGKVLMPVLAAAAAASGRIASSGAVCIAVMFAIDVIVCLIADVMAPLVWAYIALLTAGGVTENEGLFQLAKSLKNGVICALKLVLGLFVAYLIVGGVISGTADAMAVKTVKLAMSSAIPVAGSVIADAAEAVVAGAGIVRSVTGVFGILAVLAIAVLPFLRLSAQYLTFRISALLAAVAGAGALDKILNGLGDAFSLILALTGSCAALLLIGVFVSAAGVTA